MFGNFAQALGSVVSKVATLATSAVSQAEAKVLEATDHQPWGPHGTLMGEIAKMTRADDQDYDIIMKALGNRLNDNGEGNDKWRQIYKTMLVIEFLAAQGSPRCPRDLADEFLPRLKELTEFTYVDPTGRDQGINVRNRAAVVANLLGSPAQVEAARAKAEANANKYSGISSAQVRAAGGVIPDAPGGSSGDGHHRPTASGDSFESAATASAPAPAAPAAAAPKFAVKINDGATKPAPAPALNLFDAPPAPAAAPNLLDLFGGPAPPVAAPPPSAFGNFGSFKAAGGSSGFADFGAFSGAGGSSGGGGGHSTMGVGMAMTGVSGGGMAGNGGVNAPMPAQGSTSGNTFTGISKSLVDLDFGLKR